MAWWEVELRTNEEAADAISEMFSRIGAIGIATEDPADIREIILDPDSLVFTDPEFLEELPDYVNIKAYFAEESYSEQSLQDKLTMELSSIAQFLSVGEALTSLSYTLIKEEDWAENWKKHYKSQRIGEHLVICPSWENYSAKEGDKIIRLDPGSAFGTGDHETTNMCLEFLESCDLKDKNVLDLGSGSGILAIAAALLEAKSVEAIDLDPNAVKVAEENFKLNELALGDELSGFSCHQGDIYSANKNTYDLILANILAEVHMDLCSVYKEYMRENSLLVLSGIIKHKLAPLLEQLEYESYSLVHHYEKNDWQCLVLQKR